MADNLKLQQQINAAIAERNKLLEDGEKLITNQAKLFAVLNDAIAQKKSLDQINELLEKLKVVGETLKQNADEAESSNEKMAKSFEVAADEVEMTSQKVSSLSDTFKKEFPFAVEVGSAALTGFGAGLKNIFAGGKMALGMISSIAGAMWNVGKSILAIPFKIFSGLIDKATAGGGGNELAQAYENVRKEFGSFKEDVSKNVITAARSMEGELANTGLSVWRVMGNLAERLKHVTELAKAMGPVFHIFGTEIAKNAEYIVGFEKGLGLSGEQMKAVGERAKATGKPMIEQFREMANYSLQLGQNFGISSKLISRDVGSMLKDVKHFGSLGVKELSSISVFARKLGIDFTKLLGLIDKFDTFEDAAENSAKLSQAFGVQINAYEMMKEQDPAKRFDTLRKAFQAAGKSADGMSRQELKLLAQTSGLDEETAKLGLSTANMGLSYDDVKKKAEVASKKQLSQTEVMKKLADSIERLVQAGNMANKGFWGQWLEGITRGIQTTPEFIELMFTIRRSLREVMFLGVSLGRALVKLAPNFSGLLKGITAVFRPVPDFFKGLNDSITTFLDPKKGAGMSVQNLMDSVESHFKVLFSKESGIFREMLPKIEGIMKFLASTFASGLKYVVPKITEGLHTIAALLRDPKKFLEGMKTSTGARVFMSIIEPLIEVAKDEKMWKGLWDAMKEVLSLAWEKIKPMLKSIKVPSSIWVGIATALFGPMFARVGGTIAGHFLSNAVKSMLEKNKDAVKKAAEEGTSKLGSSLSGVLSKVGGFLTKVGGFLTNPVTIAAGAAVLAIGLGTMLSHGIDKFGDEIDKQLPNNSKINKKAAAGMAGLAQTLSFGMMSDESAIEFGISISRFVDNASKTLDQKLGKDLAKDVKDTIENGFSVLIDVGDFVRNLFKGNFKDAGKSFVEGLGHSFQMNFSFFKTVFLTLPATILEGLLDSLNSAAKSIEEAISKPDGALVKSFFTGIGRGFVSVGEFVRDNIGPLIAKFATLGLLRIPGLIISTITSVAGSIFKVASNAFGVLGDALGKVLGKPFIKVKEFLDFVATQIPLAGSVIKQMLDKISNFVDKKINKQSAEPLVDHQSEIDAQLERIKGNADLMNKAAAEVEKTKDPLDALSFKFADPAKLEGLAKNSEALKASSESLKDIFKVTEDLTKNLEGSVVEKTFNGVFAMVENVSKLQNSLQQMVSQPINLVGQLRELSTRLGLGANQKFSISNNGVNINIDLKVTMEAGKVEEVILQRKDSKIRKTFDVVPGDKAAKEAALGPPKVL